MIQTEIINDLSFGSPIMMSTRNSSIKQNQTFSNEMKSLSKRKSSWMNISIENGQYMAMMKLMQNGTLVR